MIAEEATGDCRRGTYGILGSPRSTWHACHPEELPWANGVPYQEGALAPEDAVHSCRGDCLGCLRARRYQAVKPLVIAGDSACSSIIMVRQVFHFVRESGVMGSALYPERSAWAIRPGDQAADQSTHPSAQTSPSVLRPTKLTKWPERWDAPPFRRHRRHSSPRL